MILCKFVLLWNLFTEGIREMLHHLETFCSLHKLGKVFPTYYTVHSPRLLCV